MIKPKRISIRRGAAEKRRKGGRILGTSEEGKAELKEKGKGLQKKKLEGKK